MDNFLIKYIPRGLRRKLRKVYYLPSDFFSFLFKKRNELVPPKGKIFIGGGDFESVGTEFLGYFKDLCHLKREDEVLDIGCGIGRMAVPLTKYLNSGGRYEGFDVVAEGIEWCREKISSKFPNFNFQIADIFNKDYNPKGKYLASEYKFPYPGEKFDFVFLTSVFTHMLPKDVENYLSEIYRVLKPGSICLATYFLLNEESVSLMNNNMSSMNFQFGSGVYRSTHKTIHEAVVAYQEDYIKGLYSKIGYKISEPIHYGSFCGREKYLSFQDIIIASKP